MVISDEMIRVLKWFRAQVDGWGTSYDARMNPATKNALLKYGWLAVEGGGYEITGKGLDLLSGLA